VKIFRKHVSLELLNAHNDGTLAQTLGIRISEVGDDFLRGRMPVDARNKQPFGLLHGGASVALAETLGSLAGWLCLENEAAYCVGVEINANHLKAMRSGEVIGTARALHLGRSTQVWEIRICDQDDNLVCVSRLTLAVITPK
jgi:uncharacterized protein (TIGR00369 family)